MILLSREQRERLWGDGGPYSQIHLTTETRILDKTPGRTFVYVDVEMNPLTFEIMLQNRERFHDDVAIQQFLDEGEYQDEAHGYFVRVFCAQGTDKRVLTSAKRKAKEAQRLVVQMHAFVMDLLDLDRKSS